MLIATPAIAVMTIDDMVRVTGRLPLAAINGEGGDAFRSRGQS